eukprot:1140052-Rhodomonas_salina.1
MPATQHQSSNADESPAKQPGCFAKVFPCFAPSTHKKQNRAASANDVAVHADLVRQNQNVPAPASAPEKPFFVPEQPSGGPTNGSERRDSPDVQNIEKPHVPSENHNENRTSPEENTAHATSREVPRVPDEDGDAATTQSSHTNLSPPA